MIVIFLIDRKLFILILICLHNCYKSRIRHNINLGRKHYYIAKEEVKCCNLCGNIYITKDAYVAHMKTNHSNEMKNGFEHYDRKLPNKVNDELVETLKKVKNEPMPKSRKKFLFSNACEINFYVRNAKELSQVLQKIIAITLNHSLFGSPLD